MPPDVSNDRGYDYLENRFLNLIDFRDSERFFSKPITVWQHSFKQRPGPGRSEWARAGQSAGAERQAVELDSHLQKQTDPDPDPQHTSVCAVANKTNFSDS